AESESDSAGPHSHLRSERDLLGLDRQAPIGANLSKEEKRRRKEKTSAFSGKVQERNHDLYLPRRKPMSKLSHDSQGAAQMQLPPRLLDLWESEIVPQLPTRLDEQARSLKAYPRYREIERASDLLRALLAWVLGGCSFRQLGCWAVLLGVADISEAAWCKRVRTGGEWLQWLMSEVLSAAS